MNNASCVIHQDNQGGGAMRLKSITNGLKGVLTRVLLGGLLATSLVQAAGAASLADRPLFSTTNVPGNLMLALSVEWPTASTPAYLSTAAYSASTTYLGYFVPTKCYQYNYVIATPETSYFSAAVAASSGACTSTLLAHRWSGNYLNWAAMQSLDIFRWTLTGGDRAVDTATQTILEKTRHSGQGGDGNYPNKTLTAGVSGASPFSSASLDSQVQGLGTFMKFSPVASVSCSFNVNSNRRALFTCTPTGGSAQSCNTANSRPVAGGSNSCNIGPVAGMTIACTATRSAAGVNSGNTYGFSCVGNSAAVSIAAQTCAATSVNYVSNTADATCTSGYDEADYTGTGALLAGTRYRAQIRVKACDAAGGGVEPTCKPYGTNSKPEGLMQEYAMQLRFGAFGYLNDGSITRDGGVLRAQIRSIGPQTPVPGSAPVTNSNTEWSATTGVFNANPDAAAATQTSTDAAAYYPVTVNNSGVINYLNKFGKLTTSDYKGFDPVSEMYYAATRYFRNQGNVPAYSSLAGAGSQANLAKWIDGFPVIRQWNDPIQYSCQKNFILGMGDVYAWMDKNLPGSTITNLQNAGNWAAKTSEPTMPSEVSGDTAVNVTTATNMVGQLEGLSNLGTTFARDGNASERANSSFIAGLAYEAHTRDIRPEAAMPGMQTISTYWLDVREAQTYESKNQYWLAAKYGGFTVPNGFNPYATTNGTTTLTSGTWTTTGETVGADARPDNYFIASNPAAMVNGLRNAFARIAAENAAATSTAFSTTTANTTRTGTGSYATTYNPRGWTGDVIGSELSFDANGDPVLTGRWNASSILDATLSTNRKIVTCCSSGGAGVPFRYTNMTSTALATRTNLASFGAVPGVTSQSSTNYLSYLRGDRTQELSNGGPYRTRTSVLGDIVGSRANPVGKPQFPYTDQFNPGYGSFKSTYTNRKTVVYVGANDGMVHAFDGAMTGTTAGSELFAFIPSFAYGDNSTAPTQGLASLGNPNFVHHYLVDATAQNFDVDFNRTSGATTTAADWRTILLGGLGKGGRGYYALDVTDPASWTSETAVASKVLWEFTDTDMGYSFAEPRVVKTAKYGWTVLLSSGYSNSDGKGYLFLVNPRTGALLEKIATSEGSTTTPLDMAHMALFIPSTRDYTVESVYAGDLQGNVWRFDLRGTGTFAAPTKIARLTDATGNAQPVTTVPRVAVDTDSSKRYVSIATGRLLDDSDIASGQRQTIYVIADGTSTAGNFFTAATLPGSASFPITRSQLNNNTNPLLGIGSTPLGAMGYYYDLGVASNGVAERVTVDMDTYQGAVAAAINLPNGDACSPAGSGRVVSLSLADGRTTLLTTDLVTGTTTPVATIAFNTPVTNLQFFTVAGETGLLVGRGGGGNSVSGGGGGGSGVDTQLSNLDTKNPSTTLRRLNWREVQTAN
jgi:type IV pilus assembly protein PilY1